MALATPPPRSVTGLAIATPPGPQASQQVPGRLDQGREAEGQAQAERQALERVLLEDRSAEVPDHRRQRVAPIASNRANLRRG